MDYDRWQQVDNLLQSALQRPPAERDAFLRQACAGNQALEREVRALLASHQEAGSFLEGPAIEAAVMAIARENKDNLNTWASLTGQTISHHRIAEKLGASGMGVVWKARDTRLDRFVALKLLTADKMSDPERKRRFVHEAKSASALNHPNIITVYDIDQAYGADLPCKRRPRTSAFLKGTLWVGTSLGLTRIDGSGRIRTWTKKDGLAATTSVG